MEYTYGLQTMGYLKYYIMYIYYRFLEFPLMIRVCAIAVTIFIILYVLILLLNVIIALKIRRREKKTQALREKYYDKISELTYDSQTYPDREIAEKLEIGDNYKVKKKFINALMPSFLDIKRNETEGFNKENFVTAQRVFGLPTFFENMVVKGNLRERVISLKWIDMLEGEIKESIVSRYLYNKVPKVQLLARLHVAKTSKSYPFNTIEEDLDKEITPEVMAKYHEAFVYRLKQGLQIPNFLMWCTAPESHESFKIFALKEIANLKMKDDAPAILEILKTRRNTENVERELITTLGKLKYSQCEEYLMEIYDSASYETKRTILITLGDMASDNYQVVDFLREEYSKVSDYFTREVLLSVLYDYGARGRAVFNVLEAQATPDTQIFFDHVRNPLIDNRKYA